MENLKFRAWNIIVNRMQYFTFPEIEKQKGEIQWHILKIQLFGGFQDKNGKDVFVGDIYDNGCGDLYQVFFVNGCFCGGKNIENVTPLLWEVEYEDVRGSDEVTGDVCKGVFNKKFNIVGNIYENPELL